MILAVESGSLEPAPCSGLGLWWQPTKVENTVKTNGIEVPCLREPQIQNNGLLTARKPKGQKGKVGKW